MQRVVHLSIDGKRCQTCLPCLAAEACKVRAFVRFDPDDPPFLDVSRCYDCRLCIPVCPFEAVSSRNRGYSPLD